ncbi:hypothetical protein [Escherichia coli]|uniref:hypothetical protein n=2 Tax=Escherichia coli TaxID=562 RepID=UPI0013772890|nr:hypothetical protein [Escherichia coli]
MNKILKLCDWLLCSRLMRTPWPLAGLTLCMFIISMLCGWRSVTGSFKPSGLFPPALQK